MSDGLNLADLRTLIRDQPGIVLDDPDLMRDLAEHAEGSFGGNVVDLRGAALKVLERRRDTLERSNRMITRASQKNFASVQRIHRASIPVLQAGNVREFCAAVNGPVKDILRIDRILVLVEEPFPGLCPNTLFGPIKSCHPGFVLEYFGNPEAYAAGRIRLRRCPTVSSEIYRTAHGPEIESEALLPLSLKAAGDAPETRNPEDIQDVSLMLLGSKDRRAFQPGMGTDLLAFFREVAECALRRWTV